MPPSPWARAPSSPRSCSSSRPASFPTSPFSSRRQGTNMKRDIDHLMNECGLGAAIVLQGKHMSLTFRYLTGPRAHLKGIVVWRPGQKPYLVHHAMERDSAAATGFTLGDYGSLGWMKQLEEQGHQNKGTAVLIQKAFA